MPAALRIELSKEEDRISTTCPHYASKLFQLAENMTITINDSISI
jgi:hypothetical protein